MLAGLQTGKHYDDDPDDDDDEYPDNDDDDSNDDHKVRMKMKSDLPGCVPPLLPGCHSIHSTCNYHHIHQS